MFEEGRAQTAHQDAVPMVRVVRLNIRLDCFSPLQSGCARMAHALDPDGCILVTQAI